jgi:WD40 repeat protein
MFQSFYLVALHHVAAGRLKYSKSPVRRPGRCLLYNSNRTTKLEPVGQVSAGSQTHAERKVKNYCIPHCPLNFGQIGRCQVRKRLTLILSVIMYILLSCSKASSLPEYNDVSEQTEYSVLHFPAARFDDLIWRADGVIVALQDESVRPLRQPYALEGDDQMHYLNLEQDSKCEHTKYRYPTQIPDGRLGWIKWCVTDDLSNDASYLVAYDWKTGQLEQIVQNPLKHFDISRCFSWNPEMTKGIQAVSNGLTGTLNWLTRVGPEPVKITLRDGNRVWDLSKDFETNGSREGGRISCPAWSPKGDPIAVFVSFDAMGVQGAARLDKQSQLVLFSSETGESEAVLSGIYYPEFIEWSPNGEIIAFVGDLNNELWVFNVETQSLFLIANGGEFDDLSWSPDSRKIAVIWCEAIECEKSEIRQYLLSW